MLRGKSPTVQSSEALCPNAAGPWKPCIDHYMDSVTTGEAWYSTEAEKATTASQLGRRCVP